MKTIRVWMVDKNADFTEGRGRMKHHRVFVKERIAIDWIMQQEGISGGKQQEYNYETYPDGSSLRTFNGYDLQEVDFEIPEGIDYNENRPMRETSIVLGMINATLDFVNK